MVKRNAKGQFVKSKKRVKRNTNILGRGSSYKRGTRYYVHFNNMGYMGLDKKWHKQERAHIGIAAAKRTAKTLKLVGGNPKMKTKITRAK